MCTCTHTSKSTTLRCHSEAIIHLTFRGCLYWDPGFTDAARLSEPWTPGITQSLPLQLWWFDSIMGGCELFKVGAGNWTLTLWKSSKHPYLSSLPVACFLNFMFLALGFCMGCSNPMSSWCLCSNSQQLDSDAQHGISTSVFPPSFLFEVVISYHPGFAGCVCWPSAGF